ncbi:carboxymuconolactone decarboxylase family protein [Ornithinimicrobium cavernae]|uniref:carboxymuconolactone decarboxylase family protein n=1 Tax=Ornithinimicrobium cavernae TaxID=2666047 RepID=UPI000D68E309|nr:carboxymuconolactone decarboxylase family protein [Ornithinimicrobium cavernae]
MTFTPHTLETAPAASVPAMQQVAKKFGAVPRAVALQAESPALLTGFLAGSAAVERTSLPPLAREVVILTVAARNGCGICLRIHGATLASLGGSAHLEALTNRTALSDPALEEARLFTERLLGTSGDLPDPAVRSFLAAGFTREHALDIVFTVGIYTMSTLANRLVGA